MDDLLASGSARIRAFFNGGHIMTGSVNLHTPSRPLRKNRVTRTAFEERVDDTYKLKGKLREPTKCPICGAVFHKGRWQWLPEPADAHEQLCPACHRVHDRVPAGYVRLSGEFMARHRDEIMHLVHNHERKARTEHPLQRIMATTDQEDGVLVTTTDIHLARGIGEALEHAYQGKLNFHYNRDQKLLRVRWERNTS